MKVGEDMNKTDLKQESARSERRRAAQVEVPALHQGLPALHPERRRQRRPTARLPRAEGLASNTIVIYTSDQGFFLGDHGWFDKRFMYEESLRMPFLMRYPGAIRPNTVNHDMVLNIDFAPTFLDYAGVRRPAGHAGPQLPRHPRRPHAARLAQGDVLPLLDAQHERPPRPRPLRRPHRSLEAHLLLRQASRNARRQSAGHRRPIGNCSTFATTRAKCTTSTTTRNTRRTVADLKLLLDKLQRECGDTPVSV